MVRSTLLQAWVGAALKGESGGGTSEDVFMSRFLGFFDVHRIETEQVTVVSNVSKVADSISALVSFLS